MTHDHDYAPVVAGYTVEGGTPLSWESCRVCGADNPAKKRPAGAVDEKPEADDE